MYQKYQEYQKPSYKTTPDTPDTPGTLDTLSMSPKISVVIPAYNEEKVIASVLSSLAAQKTSYPFEVILVDNGSSDRTREIAQTFTKKLNLALLDFLFFGKKQYI